MSDDLKTAKTALAKLHHDMEAINKLAKPPYLSVIEQMERTLEPIRRQQLEISSAFEMSGAMARMGDRFQTFVDAASKWEAFPVRKQKEFFEYWVRPFLRKDNKVCVIISDAMRYEIGDELLSLIRQEGRADCP